MTKLLGAAGADDASDELSELFARWHDHGDEDAGAELLCRVVEELKRRLRKKGRSRRAARDYASDIADSAIGRLLERLKSPKPPRLDSVRALRAYLLTTVEHLLSSLERKFRTARLDADTTNLDALVAKRSRSSVSRRLEDIRVVRTALRMLTPPTRDLVLSMMREEPLAELAARLASSVDAARMRRRRAVEEFERVLRLLMEP